MLPALFKTSSILFLAAVTVDRNKSVCQFAAFEQHHRLMRNKGQEYFKSGHLRGIRSRAGYIKGAEGRLYRYVVFINTPGKATAPVMKAIYNYFE